VLKRIKDWARALKRGVYALYLAARDPRKPWHAKTFALVIAAYALSPTDLIPDFIPVLGCLNEVILLPLAILIAVRLMPPGVMAEHRALAPRPIYICFRSGAAIAACLFCGRLKNALLKADHPPW
jgi:uncharacterized membrane protein YkvA (DUF1232 family)